VMVDPHPLAALVGRNGRVEYVEQPPHLELRLPNSNYI
jgi:hypothetical protein